MVTFLWIVPYVGPNKFNCSCAIDAFTVKVLGGRGNQAVVVFVFAQIEPALRADPRLDDGVFTAVTYLGTPELDHQPSFPAPRFSCQHHSFSATSCRNDFKFGCTDVTDDFENDACFEVGQTYRLEYRLPSSPGQEEGISLQKKAPITAGLE
ncbi:hypothetical protein Forpi1262_v016757 [Fusarium oxysporum f. sp. raphani]|uniref:Uncharacterized protein n=1 Tax=Fusarium oxysporum f. sp. raphani TaxID=96318 RepID=A0A8J5TZH7_FUSOX|nr:hypothetical protein Forpi1262_v016757 [Fusarium oxysporum f. sp. raphani]